jgi:5-methylcytosine-specific restriction protein A
VKVYDDTGEPLDASFSVEEEESRWSVVLESRGGTRNTPQARNVDYIPAMDLLLRRLGQLGMRLADAAVESARVAESPLEDRRLKLKGLSYPIELRESDAVALGRALRAAQGSNPTRRIRLYVEEGASGGLGVLSVQELGAHLSVGLSATYAGEAEEPRAWLPGTAEGETASSGFDAANTEDSRRRALRAIAVRQGQPRFRKALLGAYGARCAISGCEVLEVLEAAHIRAFRGPHTNHIQNGLLLRADLHTLFDLGLIGIDTETWTVLVSPRLRGTTYSSLKDQPVRLPAKPSERPDTEALRLHREWAGL